MTTSSIVQVLQPNGVISEDREVLNLNFQVRHSLDITTVNNAASPYTALPTDQLLLVDASAGAVTIALGPAASNANRSFFVFAKSVAGGNITIDPSGAETINGAATLVLNTLYQCKRVFCDGAAWFVASS